MSSIATEPKESEDDRGLRLALAALVRNLAARLEAGEGLANVVTDFLRSAHQNFDGSNPILWRVRDFVKGLRDWPDDNVTTTYLFRLAEELENTNG